MFDCLSEMNSLFKELTENEKIMKEVENIHRIQLEELNVTSEKLKKLRSKAFDLNSALSKLKLKKEETERIVKNSVLVDVIVVDNERNNFVLNGLVDLNRDIVMKLLKIIKNETKIRNIIGVSQIFYDWSKKPVFRWVHSSKVLPVRFITTKQNRYNVIMKDNPTHCDWSTSFGTAFWAILDESVNRGVYRLILQCKGNLSSLMFGLLSQSLISRYDCTSHLCNYPGACCIRHDALVVGGTFVFIGYLYASSGTVMLALELDADAHLAYFFVNGKQIPHVVTSIPPSVHFAFTNYVAGVTVSVKTFGRFSAFNSAMWYTKYQWVT